MVFTDATKQLLIKSLPPVLTLHLKRFLQEGRRLRKNGRPIAFPALLDMAPYCVADCKVPSVCISSGASGRVVLNPTQVLLTQCHAISIVD